MHGWLFKDKHDVELETLAMLANDLLKLNKTKNTCLINLSIILFYSFSWDIHG